jgi:serine/threonine protein kinase
MGCLPWLAPEVFAGEAPTEKSDVFSLGVVLWELWSGVEPSEGMLPLNYINAVCTGHRPHIPDVVGDAWREAISRSWAQDPSERPTANDLFHILNDHFRNLAVAQEAPQPEVVEQIDSFYIEN